MRRSRPILLSSAMALVASLAAAQGIPTATLTGKVTTEGNTALPGVTVTVESPNLQGKRDAATSANGDYIFNLLPPGEYTVTFALSGMAAVERKIALAAAQTSRVDVEMKPSPVAETITVTGESEAARLLETPQVAANFKQKFIENLPIRRNIQEVTLLSPGVNNNGPGGSETAAAVAPAIMISGGQSFENLFLINGVVVNENLRGQPHDLFIEDAVAETTILTAGISAEYGRFTGGVVSTITKSGGNSLSGSYRANLTNDDWTEISPFGERRIDDINTIHEGTLGGPIWKDRLWFFGAGRQAETNVSRQTQPTRRAGDIDPTPTPYTNTRDTLRLEGKLTASVTPSHSLIGSYINIEDEEVNNTFTTNILGTESLVTRQTPNNLWAVSYNGILTDKLFLEAQYAQKEFTFENSGSPFRDLIRGTLILDLSRGQARFNSPTFANDTPEERDNKSWYVKGSYFLSTPKLGTHDVRVGYENFSETRFANNFQSGSDYRIFATSAIIRGTQVFPVFGAGDTTFLRYNPIAQRTLGTDFTTHSLFFNDRMSLGRHWSFNLGVRYDRNDGKDSRGFKVADDEAISPRLGAHYDIRGDGRLVVNASYGQYVAKLADSIADASSPAGRSATLDWFYRGPCINCDVNAATSQLIPTHRALEMFFDWFFNVQGGPASSPTRTTNLNIPGLSTQIIQGTLDSPNVKEYTVGLGATLGSRGAARVDLVYRDWDDLYGSRTDLSTGRTPPNQFGQVFDISLVENSKTLDREYTGVQTQFSYRFAPWLLVGGNYTWSRLTGNFDGENIVSGPIISGDTEYPEYKAFPQNNPTGYVLGDQRHRANLWVGLDMPTRVGNFNLSLLESYNSGVAYDAAGTVRFLPAFLQNPGYERPPTSVAYFFSKRGEFRTEDSTRTDVALNYSLRLFKSLELFLQPEVLNVFNEDALIGGRLGRDLDTTVNTRATQTGFRDFNPLTETPVRGPRNIANPQAHYDLSPTFGQAVSERAYQLPRTFRFSVGLRF